MFLLGQLCARQKLPPGSTPFSRGLSINIYNIISFWVQYPTFIYMSFSAQIAKDLNAQPQSNSLRKIINNKLNYYYKHGSSRPMEIKDSKFKYLQSIFD